MKCKIVREPKHTYGSGRREDGEDRHLMVLEIYGDIEEAKDKFKRHGWVVVREQGKS